MELRNATRYEGQNPGNHEQDTGPGRRVSGKQRSAKPGSESDKPGSDKRDRGLLRVDQSECKGCGLCAEACPPRAIRMGEQLNRFGYGPASYAGAGCTGCGICFLVCPEPGAITVMRAVKTGVGRQRGAGTGTTQPGEAPALAGAVPTGTVARAS